MFANLIENVTFTCPNCNTFIKFDVHPSAEEVQGLYSAVCSLECPKCKEPFANSATEMIRSILDYNQAVSKLSALEKCMNAELN